LTTEFSILHVRSEGGGIFLVTEVTTDDVNIRFTDYSAFTVRSQSGVTENDTWKWTKSSKGWNCTTWNLWTKLIYWLGF